jgi:glycosyltransferase involved in cell wall biosynthesis
MSGLKLCSPRWVARKLRQTSFQLIYPWAPQVHGFLFFRLRQWAIAASCLSTTRRLSNLPAKIFHGSRVDALKSTPLKITIIVPCYNHVPYLPRRLSSIAAQISNHTEVILLDDASTDGSATILRQFADNHPTTCRLIVNEHNSGSPFKQWEKGIRMATGDLIWIAESDDFCSSDFLEKTVPEFDNHAVMLAFCRTKFVADDGNTQVWSMENYVPELGVTAWKRHFTCSSFELTQQIWDRKNIIPNVSSVVFRNPSAFKLLDDPSWQSMKVCGDWIFYLQISAGGFVSFVPTTTCYYRQHSTNTSVGLHKDEIYLSEHLAVAEYLVSSSSIRMLHLQEIQSELRKRWYQNRSDPIPAHLSRRIQHLSDLGSSSGPEGSGGSIRILMVVYSLIAGGGEILPLRLANLLKERGHAVTVLDCYQHSPQEGVRRILRSDIPLVQLRSLESFGRIIDSLGIMIIHSHNAWVDTTIAELTRGACHACHVITSHGMYDEIDRDDFPRISRLLTPTVSEVAYVADKNVEPLLRLGFDHSKLTKISNAVDTPHIKPVDRSDYGIDRDDFVLCIVSRAIREKGWQEAIETMDMAQLRTSRRLHLLLVGEGSERFRLGKLYGHRSEIHFLGFQSAPCDFYAASDLGILPTFYRGESQPLTLLECLSAGRPFLTTSVGETSAMLSTPDGMAGMTLPLLNGQVDVQGFSEAILIYCNDTARYEHDSALARIASMSFSGEQMATSYEQLYRRALNSRKVPIF